MQIYAQAVWAHSISKHMQLITDSILIFLHTTCPVPTGQGRPKSQSDPWKAACSCRLTAASDVTATTGSSGADDLWSSHFAPHIDQPQAADQVGVDERHHQMLSHSHERLCKRAHIYTHKPRPGVQLNSHRCSWQQPCTTGRGQPGVYPIFSCVFTAALAPCWTRTPDVA